MGKRSGVWWSLAGLLEDDPEPNTHRHSLITDCQVELRLLLFRFDPLKPTIAVAFPNLGIYALSVQNSGPSNRSKLLRLLLRFPSHRTHNHPSTPNTPLLYLLLRSQLVAMSALLLSAVCRTRW